MTLSQKIGRRLREVRILAGYKTITSFTSKHKIPRSTYNQYETGDRFICVDSATKFAYLFKTNLIWLLTGKGDKQLSDDDILAATHQKPTINLLSEQEFLSIAEGNKQKTNPNINKTYNKIDIELFNAVVDKVCHLFGISSNESNFKKILELSCTIYSDIINIGTDKEKFNILDIISTSFEKYISYNKKKNKKIS